MLAKIKKFLLRKVAKEPMDTMTVEQKIINELIAEHGMSKWQIMKQIKTADKKGEMKPVTWQTVHLWHQAVYRADELHMRQLRMLLTMKREENGTELFPAGALQPVR